MNQILGKKVDKNTKISFRFYLSRHPRASWSAPQHTFALRASGSALCQSVQLPHFPCHFRVEWCRPPAHLCWHRSVQLGKAGLPNSSGTPCLSCTAAFLLRDFLAASSQAEAALLAAGAGAGNSAMSLESHEFLVVWPALAPHLSLQVQQCLASSLASSSFPQSLETKASVHPRTVYHRTVAGKASLLANQICRSLLPAGTPFEVPFA